MTVAVYVVSAPVLTLGDASSDVELESRPTTTVSPGLTEPARIEPAVGENAALRLAVDAANEVEHATVALWPFGVTARSAHPSIGAPPSSKVTVPKSAVLVLTIDVTVAINVTGWLVTALVGGASRLVVVGNGPAGVWAAVRTGPAVALVEARCRGQRRSTPSQ